MSPPAPPIARRLALLSVLLCALILVLPAVLAPNDAPAEAAESAPASPSGTDPAPSPSASPTSPAAQVSLMRAACDAVHLTAQTSPGVTLAYRVTDEGGHVVASGTFAGSIERTISLSTGHDYLASVSETAGGPALATSSSASLREACAVAVTADSPAFADPCGTERDAVVAPQIIGVDYRVGETLLVAGPNAAYGTVTVEASARAGYMLNGPSRWTHTFSAEPCAAPDQAGLPTRPSATEAAPRDPTQASGGSAQSVQAAPSTPGPVSHGPADARDDSAERFTEPAAQASTGAPGPLAWGIMIAVAVAGGIAFWFKTRH